MNGDGLPENGREGLSKGGLIGLRETSKFFENERWINGCDDRFNDGWPKQPRTLPILDLNLTHREGRGLLTRDSHDEEIRAYLMVGRAANNHGRATFGS